MSFQFSSIFSWLLSFSVIHIQLFHGNPAEIRMLMQWSKNTMHDAQGTILYEICRFLLLAHVLQCVGVCSELVLIYHFKSGGQFNKTKYQWFFFRKWVVRKNKLNVIREHKAFVTSQWEKTGLVHGNTFPLINMRKLMEEGENNWICHFF